MAVGKSKSVNMTNGSIVKLMLNFSLPIFAGNLFQQLYNMVDTWTVGNFVSNEAFSAVGTVAPICNMLIGAFMGFATGAAVLISQYFGAGDEEKVHKAVHTAAVTSAILSVAVTLLGLLLTPWLLGFMNLQPEVFAEAKEYLTIYFAGSAGLLLYNMGSAILRAVGDSQRPFYYLVVCSVLNIVLDLLFVIRFRMGVAGVAYATIISQAVSAFLTVRTLFRSENCLRLSMKDMHIHTNILKIMVRLGIPNALQMAIVAFSNIFVQGYINYFGTDVTSGWTAYLKLDAIIMLPMLAVAQATMTFVGQNLGVGDVKRAKKGVRTGLALGIGITLGLAAILTNFAPQMVAFFNDKPEVVDYGSKFMRIMMWLAIFSSVNQTLSSALRGAGNSLTPMIIMVVSFSLCRQIYLYVMANYISNTVIPIALGYPFGWIICSTLLIVYYLKVGIGRNRLVGEKDEK